MLALTLFLSLSFVPQCQSLKKTHMQADGSGGGYWLTHDGQVGGKLIDNKGPREVIVEPTDLNSTELQVLWPLLDMNKDGFTDPEEMMRGYEEHRRTRARADIVKLSIEAADKVGANGQKPGIYSDQKITKEEMMWDIRQQPQENFNSWLKSHQDPESEDYDKDLNVTLAHEDFENFVTNAQTEHLELFHVADLNKNGELDLEELVDLNSKTGERGQRIHVHESKGNVERLDQNGDGKVSVREFYHEQIQEQIEEGKGADVPKPLKEQFMGFDADGDGLLTAEEFVAIANHRSILKATCADVIKNSCKDGKICTQEEFPQLKTNRLFPQYFRNVVNWVMGKEDENWGKQWVEGDEEEGEEDEYEGKREL